MDQIREQVPPFQHFLYSSMSFQMHTDPFLSVCCRLLSAFFTAVTWRTFLLSLHSLHGSVFPPQQVYTISLRFRWFFLVFRKSLPVSSVKYLSNKYVKPLYENFFLFSSVPEGETLQRCRASISAGFHARSLQTTPVYLQDFCIKLPFLQL